MAFISRQKAIVLGVVLVGLLFFITGLLVMNKRVKYYAHSLRNYQEADTVAGYPIAVGEGEGEEKEFFSAQFDPALNLFSSRDRYRVPEAMGFDFPLGTPDGGLVRELESKEGVSEVRLQGLGGGLSSLGDPVSAVADGLVMRVDSVGDGLKAIWVAHRVDKDEMMLSFYTPLLDCQWAPGAFVYRGQLLGGLGAAELRFDLFAADGLPTSDQPHRGGENALSFLRKRRPAQSGSESMMKVLQDERRNSPDLLGKFVLDAQSAEKLSEILSRDGADKKKETPKEEATSQ